jgi:hypothetical protein
MNGRRNDSGRRNDHGRRGGLVGVLVAAALLWAMLGGITRGVAPAVDGNVYSLQLGSTLHGIRAALAEKSGTMILAKDDLILFMWGVHDGWAFAGINAKTQSAVNVMKQVMAGANLVNINTMRDLAAFLKEHGFEVVTASQVPQVVHAAVGSSTGWLARLAGSMPTVLVLPVGVLLTPEELERYRGYQGDI